MLKRLSNLLRGFKEAFSFKKHNRKEALAKKKLKNKILDYLKTNHKASNSQLRKITGLSSRSIVRYMNELEKEGLVEQFGKDKKHQKYRLK